MAYINARLRNPNEVSVATVKTAHAKPDWIGGACAILAFCLATATLILLYLDWDLYTNFIGR